MGSSSSRVSQYESVETKTVSDYASSYTTVVSSSSSARQIEYDVFVSFRGSDIREGLLSHLIEAFPRKQIVAFVDDNLERGHHISEALLGAIERSLISLVIFSEDYASSHWCLEELAKIIECRKKYEQIVIPVFFNVDPSDVRNQKGTYGNAFTQHERKYTETQVQTWRDALRASACLSGFHSTKFRNEAELIEEIIKCVKINLRHMYQVHNPGHSNGFLGIDKPIAHLKSFLLQKSEDVRVIGIWGMGGIGKTTLAEKVYKQLCSEFQSCSFLKNVREESKRCGIYSVREKLFSELLDEKDLKIETPNGLPSDIETRLGRMKVLIVLDDVNDAEELETLVGTHERFGSGSRIIVTSRDRQVLVKKADEIHKVEKLMFDEALQLFNLHAFKKNHLDMQYYELSKSMVNYTTGIPLVLIVLGSLLHGKGKKIWESQLEKLRKMPIKKVYDIMILSYDELDHEEQQIFLDIGCFFAGLNLKAGELISLLKDDYSVAVGLERLIDKALTTISRDKIVCMHDAIRGMAREIVRRESIEGPKTYSRVWDPNGFCQVLKVNTRTEAIRSISVDLSQVGDMMSWPPIFAEMSELKFLDIYGRRDHLFVFPAWLQSLCNGLRYFRWTHYPLMSLPMKFPVESIVILELTSSRALRKLWHNGVQNLVNLKVIRLDDSSSLMELPDFSKATKLEKIDCRHCPSLTRVHPSIFSLEKLETLDLTGSTSLTQLQSHVHSRSLRYLNLDFCFSLKEFAVTSENMIQMFLGNTRVSSLPSSFGRQRKLEFLHLGHSDIVSLPASIKHLVRLKYLTLYGCKKLETLPELPPSIDILEAGNCASLRNVVFPATIDEQLKENKSLVAFWNCLELDQHSLSAIELNVRINIMKFTHQQLIKESDEDVYVEDVYVDDMAFNTDRVRASYVYPGSSIPDWLEYRTTENYITIDLSSACTQIAFIFSFILPKCDPSWLHRFKFNIRVGDNQNDSVNMYTDPGMERIEVDHVSVIYDQRVSGFLNSRARDQNRLKIIVSAKLFFLFEKLEEVVVLLKGFGIQPIYPSDYKSLAESLESGASKKGSLVGRKRVRDEISPQSD